MAEIFKFLTTDDEQRLLASAAQRHFADGDPIVREAHRSRSLYILRSGQARVERSHGEFSVEISVLESGELFGEMGFVEEFEASASVVAVGECAVDEIDEALVIAMIDKDAGFAGRFYRSIAFILSRRLRATSVEALSEFAWGTGAFARAEDDGQDAQDRAENWGGGSPLRDSS